MSELYDRIVSERSSYERLLARIPSFSGYLNLSARRAADRTIRDYVADIVSQHLNRFVYLQKQVLDGESGLLLMSDMESARTQWQTYHDRIKAAAPGYAGFFALFKVEAEDLERLYSFDEAQVQYANRFDEAVSKLEQVLGKPEAIQEAITLIEQQGREANEALRLRDDLLVGLSK
jgi:hypothetical protein